jgi:hypothetical protein
MKLTPLLALIVQLAFVPAAQSQTFGDLQVSVRGMTVQTTGGERESVGMSTGPIAIGKLTTAVFALNECGNFSVSAGSRMLNDPTTVWRVEVTPTRVEGRAVTFRLKWVRSRDNGKDTSGPSGEAELTLRPGESMPIDIVPLTLPAIRPSDRVCDARAASIRVAADDWPIAQDERRLIASDLWLIERLADGTERGQPLSIRGLPNHPTDFYFDSIVDGGVALDIYGHVIARPQSGVMDVTLETRSRLTQGGQSSQIWRQGNMYSARRVESAIRLKPEEVVDVALPRLSENESGAFANRVFSIRIRARQVR